MKYFRKLLVGFLIGIGSLIVTGTIVAIANYTATQGAGTTVGSIVIGGVHFLSQLFCDATTANQCASVSVGGAVKVDASASTQPVSSTTLATAANQATEIASLSSIDTKVGSPVPIGSTGGITPLLLNSVTTPVTAIKSSAAGQLFEIYCYNPNATVSFAQIFDVATAGAVTLGATSPVASYGIPATQSAGKTLSLVGSQFSNGIQIAATTTATGSTANSSAVNCNASFK